MNADDRAALDRWITAHVDNCPLKPAGPKLVLLPDEPTKKSKGGLLLPENAVEKPCRGLVVAVGHLTEPHAWLKPGMVVMYERYAGGEVEVGNVTYRVLNETAILAQVVV